MTGTDQEMLVVIGKQVGLQVTAVMMDGRGAVKYGATVTCDVDRAFRDLRNYKGV